MGTSDLPQGAGLPQCCLYISALPSLPELDGGLKNGNQERRRRQLELRPRIPKSGGEGDLGRQKV